MDQILCKSDLPKLSKSPKIDAHELMPPSNGLTASKLKQANASTGDVLSGKSFYAGDKNLKTGTMANHGAWSGTFSGGNVGIPAGYHNGAGSVGVAGGNRGSWGTTINPGGSVTIPQGWHNGSGMVTANNVQSQLKRGTVSHAFGGSDWAQRATLPCAGTVIGITDVRGTGSTYIDQSVAFNNCPDGRGIRIRISGSSILVEADNLVSTNTMWIDYVYI